MTTEPLIVRDVIDGDELPALADLVTDGGLDTQFTAGLKSECDSVAHRAGNPPIFGDARDRGEAEAGHQAHDLEDLRNDVDLRNGGEILGKVLHVKTPF